MRYFLLVFALVLGCQEREDRQDPQIEVTESTNTSADAETPPIAFTTDLPKGISSVTSVEVTVRGTATEYKYAFTSDLGAGCSDAGYGNSQSLNKKLKIDDLGADGIKTVCIVGRSSDGTEQEQPELYQWMKFTADASTPPPPEPVVTVKDIQDEYHDGTIKLEVEAENGATHYQLAFKKGLLDCEEDFEDSDYGEEKEVSADNGTFTLYHVNSNGAYTLCLRGKNGANVQDNVSQYAFEKVDPPLPESAGMLDITTSYKPTKIYFASTSYGHRVITLSNKGDSDLEWKIEAEAAIDWLKIGMAEDNLSVVSASDNLVSGTLAAQGKTTVWLRLADIYKTDYEAGKKTATLKVHNVSGGDDPVSIDVSLQVPTVELSPDPAIIKLNKYKKTGKIMLHNSATNANWAVGYRFSPLLINDAYNEFQDIVSYKTLRDASQTKYIEFSIDEDKLAQKEDGYSGGMFYMLITNTSSKVEESKSCGDDELEGGEKITIGVKVEFTPRFTTNVCYYFSVSVKK